MNFHESMWIIFIATKQVTCCLNIKFTVCTLLNHWNATLKNYNINKLTAKLDAKCIKKRDCQWRKCFIRWTFLLRFLISLALTLKYVFVSSCAILFAFFWNISTRIRFFIKCRNLCCWKILKASCSNSQRTLFF
jgi:hypothetical protein